MAKSKIGRVSAYLLVTGASLVGSAQVLAAAAPATGGRHIEDVVVTAERKESTTQDTAISITAFSSKFIEDFGLRNQEDLQNYTPATTIQPYDIAIRGVGRLFRTLGGDPGVSTYLNGVYSEDFGIASTEGGLFDIERVEVLRGPQGTLYGRNAVGGSVNFINKKPGPTFAAEGRVIGGTYGLFEMYGTINQPLIEDVLSARITGSKRTRDGYIKDTGGVTDSIDNYGDENYSLALKWTPTDTLTFNARGNERSYRRRFNGGAGADPIVVSENGGKTRDTTHLAFGYGQIRSIDNTTCAAALAGAQAKPGDLCFTHQNGTTVRLAQFIRPGIDLNGDIQAFTPATATAAATGDPDGAGPRLGTVRSGTVASGTNPNYAFNAPANLLSPVANLNNLKQNSLKVATSGNYDEGFDHQAGAYDATWVLSDKVTLKYIGGYTDYFYDRTTDEDKGASKLLGSYDFYVLQENENYQHELQVFWDPTDKLSITSGAFYYHNWIDQRLDLYDPIDTQGRYQNNANYVGLYPLLNAFGARSITNADGSPQHIDIKFAKDEFKRGGKKLDAQGTFSFFSQYTGDKGDKLRSGESTPGTFFSWDNTTSVKAVAFYTQAEWNFAEHFALTLGARYAKDKKFGEENIKTLLEINGFNFAYSGTGIPAFGVPVTAACADPNPALALQGLRCYNTATGALDRTTGLPTGAAPVRFNGIPFTFDSFLPVKKEWDKVTGRINLDWTPNDTTLVYVSATSGWRSGGFNLGFRSTNNPIYNPENVYSYEIGYKGQLFDNSLQINLSAYLYTYNDIQQIISVVGQFGSGTAVTNAPQSRTIGFEGDVLWLPTENLTVGGNWSYTRAEFTKDFQVVDDNDPSRPGTVFSPEERTINIKNNKLALIPDYKISIFADYSWSLGDYGKLDLLSSLAYTDKFSFYLTNDPLEEAPSLLRWDARVTWNSPDAKLSTTFSVNNITGEIGARNESAFGRSGNYKRAITPNDPRVAYLEVRYKLGDI